MTDYNQSRYFELLKYSQNLKNQGKNLYFENKNEYLELSSYQAVLESHIFWKNKQSFILLLKNFSNGIIDGREFCDNFFRIDKQTLQASNAFLKDFEKLENF